MVRITRKQIIAYRLKPAEKAALEELAQAADVTLSAMTREIVVQYLKNLPAQNQ